MIIKANFQSWVEIKYYFLMRAINNMFIFGFVIQTPASEDDRLHNVAITLKTKSLMLKKYFIGYNIELE